MNEAMATFRPHRIRWVLVPIAAAIVAAFAVAGARLPDGDLGAHVGPSDEVAVILIGVLLAAGLLMLLRPRVRADAGGIEVRNVVGTRRFEWSATRGVSFREGVPWARLELPADEYVPMTAIQAADGVRAVYAMRELRRLHRVSAERAHERAEQ
jgi:4-amino-4-deoxy-L-arabinose transferase-like glycosyltransferase